MRKAEDWGDLLQIEPAFEALERQILAGEVQNYRQVPPEAFSWRAWDMLPEGRLFPLLLPFLRQQVNRARLAMPPIYGKSLAEVEPEGIRSREDWQRVPLLVKDDDAAHGLRGFREIAAQDPLVMQPADASAAAVAFGSGGSLGAHTPTFVTRADRQRECQAWRRGHDYHGLVAGDRALYTYNTTHKGGQWMQESLWAHGMDITLRRPEEGPERVLENLRRYRANALFTVQQPEEAMQAQHKAAGINLHALIAASLADPGWRGLLLPGKDGRKQIEFIFLGGFEIAPYAIQLAQEYLDCTPIATLLGSSEAIPQACSTNPALTPGGMCHYNHLHLLQGPHFIEVVKPSSGGWVPVERGEEGLLVYTSWARDGTIWIRYAPGDAATLFLREGECPCGLHSPVIANVHRKNAGERLSLLLEGCAAG